jgi:hypothetical protein
LKKSIALLLFMLTALCISAQHIQYRDKKKPEIATPAGSGVSNSSKEIIKPPVKETKPVAIQPKPAKDTTNSFSSSSISRNANLPGVIKNKKMPELITGCNLSAPPDKMPQLPIVINDVAPELVAKLKERYKNRIYSITGLNMIDVRLKLKLKICDKDGAKFRIEYLDKDGNIVNDPNLDYFEF